MLSESLDSTHTLSHLPLPHRPPFFPRSLGTQLSSPALPAYGPLLTRTCWRASPGVKTLLSTSVTPLPASWASGRGDPHPSPRLFDSCLPSCRKSQSDPRDDHSASSLTTTSVRPSHPFSDKNIIEGQRVPAPHPHLPAATPTAPLPIPPPACSLSPSTGSSSTVYKYATIPCF